MAAHLYGAQAYHSRDARKVAQVSPKANHSTRRTWVIRSYRTLRKAERYLPPVVRGLLGVLLVLGGLLGFLPILGFWMAPIGVVLLATDIPPLRRRLMHWLHVHRRIDKADRTSKP
jgi:hypothetical protein